MNRTVSLLWSIATLILLCCASAHAAYVDNGDGTITDTATGLMWQKATAPGTYTWQQALDYCAGLTLGGRSDWRLPTRNELQSLVDYSRKSPATTFPNTVSFHYWSSTTSANNPDHAWFVDFYDGSVYGYNKSNDDYVHAVRGGSCRSFDNSTTTTTEGATTTVISTTTVTSTTTSVLSSTTTTAAISSTTTTTAISSTTTTTAISSTTTTAAISSTTTTTAISTTTIPEAGCVDNDGDGYGENCAAGPDCNDADPFYSDVCPACAATIFPFSLGRFLGDRVGTRTLLVIGERGADFDSDTQVKWETSAIAYVRHHVLFKRFMLMRVTIDGTAITTGNYRVLVGKCEGVLRVVR